MAKSMTNRYITVFQLFIILLILNSLKNLCPNLIYLPKGITKDHRDDENPTGLYKIYNCRQHWNFLCYVVMQ
jgi:hypothetical protein